MSIEEAGRRERARLDALSEQKRIDRENKRNREAWDQNFKMFEQNHEDTVFERELTYTTWGLWLWVLDFLLMRRRMNRESRIALERLKERLERPDARNKSELAAKR